MEMLWRLKWSRRHKHWICLCALCHLISSIQSECFVSGSSLRVFIIVLSSKIDSCICKSNCVHLFPLLISSFCLFGNQRKNLMSTLATTPPNDVPTTPRPPSIPPSTTCPGEATTPWAPGAPCLSTAPDHTSTSQHPPRTRTRCPRRRPTPAPPSTGRRAASAPRTSCWRSGKATRWRACPRTNSTSTTKPWWAPAGAPRHRRSAGDFLHSNKHTWMFERISKWRRVIKGQRDWNESKLLLFYVQN